MILYVIGPPCAGKSTVIHYLKKKWDKELIILDERNILLALAKDHRWQKFIQLVGRNSFAVLDATIYEISMSILRRKVAELEKSSSDIIIEFARPKYERALEELLNISFTREVVLFVDAPFSICARRNSLRAQKVNGYMIPMVELRSFFTEIPLDEQRVPCSFFKITNVGSLEELETQIEEVLYKIKSE